jgi:hypothetical protein
MEAENLRREHLQLDETNFKLDSLARVDVEEYLKDCKKSRRKSLACRAKEKRGHFEWKRQEQERKLEETSKHINHMAWDRRHIELAKQKERARVAMDALRDAGCLIQGNPFADLLGK